MFVPMSQFIKAPDWVFFFFFFKYLFIWLLQQVSVVVYRIFSCSNS